MCTGRIDLSFIFRAFSNAMDGVFIGGCWPGECHYLTEGNYGAFRTVNIAKRLLQYIGINPDRLRLEWISAAEGSRFAELMNDFSQELKTKGPVKDDNPDYKHKLEAVNSLIPYIKLVERERLRIPEKTEKAYRLFFDSDEFNQLFKELIEDRLNIFEITSLLKEKPRSSADIAKVLEMTPSEVSVYMNSSSKYGIVNYNAESRLYTLTE